jgi:hypothetical protein
LPLLAAVSVTLLFSMLIYHQPWVFWCMSLSLSADLLLQEYNNLYLSSHSLKGLWPIPFKVFSSLKCSQILAPFLNDEAQCEKETIFQKPGSIRSWPRCCVPYNISLYSVQKLVQQKVHGLPVVIPEGTTVKTKLRENQNLQWERFR